MLQLDTPDTFVLATGKTTTVRDFVKKAFDKQDRKDRVAYKLRKFKILEESIENEDYCYAYYFY